ncbi:MAG: hypothetical protein EPO26_10245 [Chloroflexota bacterium]|nr:MAG: hypothetical protein EPO26_10245 [Chloroflexota bacterium]
MSRESKTAAYTIFGTLVAFKVATAIAILLLQPTWRGAAFLTFANLIWFALVALPLVGATTFWYRRVRVRARRDRYIAAEWRIDATPARRS